MKHYPISIALTIIVFLFSCNKEFMPTPSTCRLIQIYDTHSGLQRFEYDEKDMIKTVTNIRNGHTTRSQIVRDISGRIIETLRYEDNTLKNNYSYEYLNNQLSNIIVLQTLTKAIVGHYSIKFNAALQITMILALLPNENTISEYSFDDNNKLITYTRRTADMLIYKEVYSNFNFSGKTIASNLLQHGLPFDINAMSLYTDLYPSTGAENNIYVMDEKGQSGSNQKSIIKSISTNGDLINETVWMDENGTVERHVKYEYDNCIQK